MADLADARRMGYFSFYEVNPELCREHYGGEMTDAEREAVLSYMAAAKKGAGYLGLACSRMEGTWKWWTESDKKRNAEIREAHADWVNPFRIQMPKFAESIPMPLNIQGTITGRLPSKTPNEHKEMVRRPGVNGSYDPVMLGCCDMLTPDGKWFFPEQWDTHYVAKHGLVPDREFVVDSVTWKATIDGPDEDIL